MLDGTRRVHRDRASLLCVAAAFLLHGCLVSRVLETRAQLCDEQPSRVVVTQPPGSGLRIVFEKPTLTDLDVVQIVGQEPSKIADAHGIREFTYEALPLHRPLDRTLGLTARLSFIYLDGQYKLSEVNLPERFNSLLAPPLLGAAVGIGCKAQRGVVPSITTLDLRSLDRSTLPRRDALTHLLGTPTGALTIWRTPSRYWAGGLAQAWHTATGAPHRSFSDTSWSSGSTSGIMRARSEVGRRPSRH